MHSSALTPDAVEATATPRPHTPPGAHSARGSFPRGSFPSTEHISDITPATPSTRAHATPSSTPSSTSTGERAVGGGSRWRSSRWLHYATANRERGMSTAEYAVGTIAACAFAALLFKVVSSPEVQEMLTSLIDRALKTTGK
ncbi:DUF4244 domain-containing protein [Nonomuraea deserti]|uniref:DUF4244 domain-containing protein n=1 Tax=Nonomuraea deserti TaxID=1848322 RepID=A0A4R4WAL5_9ACTN|nr:DUF4244 domain-containing protein [Nonomuraea deserti]TDD10350.1 DUF4244 domain-containing protein [Nonomuraea deserti]